MAVTLTSRIGCAVLDSLPAAILMATDINRLARGMATFLGIVRQVKVRGASLTATEQPIDRATAAGSAEFRDGPAPRGALRASPRPKGVYRAGRPRAMQTKYEK
jgi:hypothetical protein